VLSNIKTIIFFAMAGIIIVGCTDLPSDAPAFPDFQSSIKILNATRESASLMVATGADPVLTPYDTTVTVVFDTTVDTTFTTTLVDTTFIFNADSSDSSVGTINFVTDTTVTTTIDSTVTTEEFTIRVSTFKDLLVNTGDLVVSVDGASVGTLAYEGVTAYLPYPSQVYTITYTATTSKTADIVVTDSVTITNGEEGSGTGAVTVSTVATGVDATVSVSENVTFGADEQSLVILHDDDGGNRVSIYHEKFLSEKGTGSTLGLVKIINTSSATGALTVSLNDSTFLSHGLEFLGRAIDDPTDITLVETFLSGYAELPLGATLTVTDGTLSETATLTVASGKRESLIIFGTSTGFKLSQIQDN